MLTRLRRSCHAVTGPFLLRQGEVDQILYGHPVDRCVERYVAPAGLSVAARHPEMGGTVSPTSDHPVRLESAMPRGIAAMLARLLIADVSARFREYLDPVYAAARSGAIVLDGQNVFLYRGGSGDGVAEVAFGVGVAAPFAPVGSVQYVPLPVGPVAATTHSCVHPGPVRRVWLPWRSSKAKRK